MTEEVSFNNLPEAVSSLMAEMQEVKLMCQSILDGTADETWFNVQELIDYLPDHPSDQTIYRWKREGTIPYIKNEHTRTLKFKKSEIDLWLENGRHMTRAMLNAIQDAEILAKRRAKKGGSDD